MEKDVNIKKLKHKIVELPDNAASDELLVQMHYPSPVDEQDGKTGIFPADVCIGDLKSLEASHTELVNAAKAARDFLNEKAKHSPQYPGDDLYNAYAGLVLAIDAAEPPADLCDEDCEICAEQAE